MKYKDDPSIPDQSDLYRRVHPSQAVFDEKIGEHRPSSAAFKDHPNGSPMSVNLLCVMQDLNVDPVSYTLSDFPNYYLAIIECGFTRSLNQAIAHEPLQDNHAHGVVFGEKPKKLCRKLAKNCRFKGPYNG